MQVNLRWSFPFSVEDAGCDTIKVKCLLKNILDSKTMLEAGLFTLVSLPGLPTPLGHIVTPPPPPPPSLGIGSGGGGGEMGRRKGGTLRISSSPSILSLFFFFEICQHFFPKKRENGKVYTCRSAEKS